jgi:hypothetical protein
LIVRLNRTRSSGLSPISATARSVSNSRRRAGATRLADPVLQRPGRLAPDDRGATPTRSATATPPASATSQTRSVPLGTGRDTAAARPTCPRP